MVYIKNWSDFETVSFVRPDVPGVKCLKYKTYSSIILNRFESLNLRLLTSMASLRARAASTIAPAAASAPMEGKVEGSSVAEPTTTGAAVTAGATGKSASKKKKKGKK
ncbi:hypothetical protein QFC22_005500 [Naganishia vaughanmartiniae]|uniref:Uncharacterized protein n=1 Tax=Naganishia vaughanmartiniae TaxID=1424756 RepID=A0ACC2WUB6_9TREE|nr:hypothetical protein QFC22_005500 [Naganishia vaughanmartiniae]